MFLPADGIDVVVHKRHQVGGWSRCRHTEQIELWRVRFGDQAGEQCGLAALRMAPDHELLTAARAGKLAGNTHGVRAPPAPH